MRLRLLFLLALTSAHCVAQEYSKVIDQIITVNSTSSLTGYTRNTVEVPLPAKCAGYAFRITTYPKGKPQESEALFTLLKKSPVTEISVGASLAEYAIKNNDGSNVDAFIFNNVYDADNFYKKIDNNWTPCKSMPNIVRTCMFNKSCMNRTVYLGFRNNNIMQGLDIRVEVVAILSNTATTQYSYSIYNTTNTELKYLISTDKINWQEYKVRNGYSNTLTYTNSLIYFRIFTDGRYVEYTLTPDERYKLIWDQSKNILDIVHY